MRPSAIELKNGLTLLHLEVPYTQVVHCAMVLNAGTRDESPKEGGMAHFIEHMVFRGTRKRNNNQILNYLEIIGGDLNAYTTKEKTCLYASIPGKFARRSFDLLADIAFHSTLPAKDVPKEQLVIGEEIDMYKENPEEMIFEAFEGLIFPGGPLGKPILGTKESIKTFHSKKLKSFIQHHYTRERAVFCAVGAISEKDARQWAAEFLEPIKLPAFNPRQKDTSRYRKVEINHPFASAQAHRIIGGRAPHLHSRLMPAFMLLTNHLGGPAMNSRLSIKVREKHGLTYNIYSFFSPYFDRGTWGAYFACDPAQLEKATEKVLHEIEDLRKRKWPPSSLTKLKQQFIGNLMLGQESLLSRTLGYAKDYLDFGRTHSLREMIASIEKVTPAQLSEAANEIMIPGQMSMLTFSPEK
jgi:predicted Zn-dependent peptidase